MINKILVFWGVALMAILIIENMVVENKAFLFIDRNSTSWILSIVSAVIWVAIWYWLNNMLKSDTDYEGDDLNF